MIATPLQIALLVALQAGPAPAPTDDVAWDDAWLDGALADGLATPGPQAPLAAGGLGWLDRAVATSLDALPGARPLRRTIPSRPALDGTLDATLERAKARAVLAAAAAYAGADRWRTVVEAHQATQGAQGADADVLLEALGTVAGEELSGALRGLLERPGVPVVRAEARCGAAGPRVLVEVVQARRPGEPWSAAVPLCLRAGWARGEVTLCTVVPARAASPAPRGVRAPRGAAGAPRTEIRLPFCPAWIWPNAGGTGYYLTSLHPGEPLRVLPHLSAEERLALAADAAALARHGFLPLEEALSLLAPLARDADARVVTASLLLARLVEPAWLEDGERVAWSAFLRRTYGPWARTLGWLPRSGEDAGTRHARDVLVPLVAGEGKEAVLAGEALALARRWLLERRQVPDEVGWSALEAAARVGDGALLLELAAAAAQVADPAERIRLWGLAGLFPTPDPAEAALALAAARAPPSGEAAALARALGGRRRRDAAWETLQRRWDALAPRLRPAEVAQLAEAAGRAACEPRRRAEVATALGWRAAAVDGAGRALAFAFDEADACLLGRAARAAVVPRFLAGR